MNMEVWHTRPGRLNRGSQVAPHCFSAEHYLGVSHLCHLVHLWLDVQAVLVSALCYRVLWSWNRVLLCLFGKCFKSLPCERCLKDLPLWLLLWPGDQWLWVHVYFVLLTVCHLLLWAVTFVSPSSRAFTFKGRQNNLMYRIFKTQQDCFCESAL